MEIMPLASTGKAVFDELTFLSRACGYPFRTFGSQYLVFDFQVFHLPDEVTVDYFTQKHQKLLENTAVYGIRLGVVHRSIVPFMAKTVVFSRPIFYSKLGDFSLL